MRGRRARLTATIVATAALAACVSSGPVHAASAAPQPPESARPNVVMITLDDLAESDLAVMPRTRRLLADQGTTMTQGLAPTPICAPARASLLTGQYAHNHGVLTVEGEAGGAAAFNDRRTLPTWLRTAGYDTMFAGKYLNGYGTTNPRYIPPGWNQWRASVDFTTYSFFKTKFNRNGKVVQPPGYNTDILARYTEELLAQHEKGRRSGDPFFLWVNYVAPHHGGPDESDDPKQHWPGGRTLTTTSPAPRDRNAFSDVDLPKQPAMWERDLRGNPHAGSHPPQGYRQAMREAYQQRLESLLAADEAVARTVAALRRSGELDRTVIALTSDNGFMVGQHNLFGKLWFYDASVRIPIILRGPGIPRGRTLATPITNPDLAVTIAALANARPTRTRRRGEPDAVAEPACAAADRADRGLPGQGRTPAHLLRHPVRRPHLRAVDQVRLRGALRPGRRPGRAGQPRAETGVPGDPAPAADVEQPVPRLLRYRLSAGLRARPLSQARVLVRIVLSAQTTAMSNAMMTTAHTG